MELASKDKGPKILRIVDLHSPWGFTQKPLNYLGRGLDDSGKPGILAGGLGVDQAIQGRHSRVEEGSSQRKSKRRPEVDPIVRFFTSTG